MPADTDVWILKRRRRGLPSTVRRPLAVAGAIAGSLGLLVVLNAFVFVDPSFVDRVTVENDSEYDVHVTVGPASGDELLPLGVATQHCTRGFLEVLDQGPSWAVRLRAQGVEMEPIVVSRAELEASDWTFVIPERVAEEFRRVGAPPSPKQGCASTR